MKLFYVLRVEENKKKLKKCFYYYYYYYFGYALQHVGS